MISAEKIRAIRKMASDGTPVKDIAHRVGVSQPTVRAYINNEQRGVERVHAPRPNRTKMLAKANQQALLELYKLCSYNCAVLTKKINAAPSSLGLPRSFKIASRTVRTYMAEVAPKPTFAAPVPQYFESDIGQQLQIDFTQAKYKFKGDLKERLIYIFEAVYPWSHQTYFKILPDMTQASWLRGISGCLFKYGIPQEILCDNDKSLVTSNTGNGIVRFNKEFQWFCKQFEIKPIACRPGRPQTKGIVERAGRYLKHSGFAWVRVFHPEVSTVDELDAAIQEWNDTCASIDRKFDVYLGEDKLENMPVNQLFAIEQKHLGFIDPKFDLYVATKMVKVSKRGYVHIHGCAITLPIDYANSDVCVMVCSKGHYLITNLDSIQITEGAIPAENLIKYKFDEQTEKTGKLTNKEENNKQNIKPKPIDGYSLHMKSSALEDSREDNEIQGYRLFFKE